MLHGLLRQFSTELRDLCESRILFCVYSEQLLLANKIDLNALVISDADGSRAVLSV